MKDTSNPSKPSPPISASKRTIGLFSGQTELEAAQEAERIAAAEDLKDEHKSRQPLSPNTERSKWEAKGTTRLKGVIQGFRVSEASDGGYVLERMSVLPGQEPYFYGVFSFPRELAEQLRDALVERLK